MITNLVCSAMLTMASFYGAECAGKPMAGGGPFNPAAMTCASWDYAFGTRLAVTHGTNVVVVTCTDRGPAKRLCAAGRRLDLSRAAFAAIAPLERGVIKVKVEVVK